mgnify:CR=1 FL=1
MIGATWARVWRTGDKVGRFYVWRGVTTCGQGFAWRRVDDGPVAGGPEWECWLVDEQGRDIPGVLGGWLDWNPVNDPPVWDSFGIV